MALLSDHAEKIQDQFPGNALGFAQFMVIASPLSSENCAS